MNIHDITKQIRAFADELDVVKANSLVWGKSQDPRREIIACRVCKQEPKVPLGEGWLLLPKGSPIQPGDGFLHPDYPFWISYECRPDMFREGKGSETAHTWPWRRQSRIQNFDAWEACER